MGRATELLGGDLLSYGISGFAVIMIGMTYFLMRTEFKRDDPRPIALKTIWMFMGLSFMAMIVVGFFSVPVTHENRMLTEDVNELAVDVSALMAELKRSEFAISQLVDEIKADSPSKPDKINPKDSYTLDTYVDYSKFIAPKVYSPSELNDSIRKDIKSNAQVLLQQNRTVRDHRKDN